MNEVVAICMHVLSEMMISCEGRSRMFSIRTNNVVHVTQSLSVYSIARYVSTLK